MISGAVSGALSLASFFKASSTLPLSFNFNEEQSSFTAGSVIIPVRPEAGFCSGFFWLPAVEWRPRSA